MISSMILLAAIALFLLIVIWSLVELYFAQRKDARINSNFSR